MNSIHSRILEAIQVKQSILSDEALLQLVQSITKHLTERIRSGSSIYFCGNGGSAADAQHLATELSGRFYLDRRAIRAEALGTNPAFNSAIGNDYNFEKILSRSLEALGREGDVLFAMSTSGTSPNILQAIAKAKELSMSVIGFTGAKGGNFIDCCDYIIKIPSEDTPRIQEAHMLLGHIICEHIELELFG